MTRTKFTLLIILSTIISFHSIAQEENIRDRRTNPDLYFLQKSDVANSLELLPAPPEPTDILFLNDRAQYEIGKMLRDTPRGEQAYHDAYLGGGGIADALSEAFGVQITEVETPQIYKLLNNMREDAGDLATRDAKEHYMRVRPYVFFQEPTCTPDHEETLSRNGSYPSGHTAIGWASALVLCEINPERQNEILKRGFEIGQSRVICGYHYQSDVDAARIVASAVVARLHAEEAFMIQLNKAKDEFKELKKDGKIN